MVLPSLYYCDDKLSFAYATVRTRWPKIIEGAIKDADSLISDESKRQSFINHLQQLLKSLENDGIVEYFNESDIQLVPELHIYNESLTKLNTTKPTTWKTGPWLYLECLFYQLFNLWCKQLDLSIDIFENLKNQTFQQSELGVLELCKHYTNLDLQNKISIDDETHELLFKEFIDISLWGNATDLSLLAGNVTLDDIKSLQGAEVRKQNEKNILINDTDSVWKHLQASSKSRIDIVLDNSGFELFADFILILMILDTKLTEKVHIHCKEIPWFVSDTLPKDCQLLLTQLVDKNFYHNIYNQQESKDVINVHDKISDYINRGKLIIESDPFWTLDLNFWSIPKFDKLYHNLLKSDLVIFKGDLNYRKLTGDLQWDKTTPFKTAIQDLATSKLPILSLRTCKADVVVGLPQGLHEELTETYKSMGNEIGEFWSSSGKWAVISFSNGQ